jgi:hypothetical protein
MEVLNWFGPPLVKLTADPAVVDSLNNYIDQILSKAEHPKELDYTEKLRGKVYGGYEVKKGFLHNVETYLMGVGKDFFHQFSTQNIDNLELFINNMWVVSHPRNMWSTLHSHNADISGIIYLKMPEELREGFPKHYENILSPAAISFTQGSPGKFHQAIITVEPKVGDVLLFPANMVHTVYPFLGPGERRSFSFNLGTRPKKPI